jgi:DNA (cytosine-5)-methyltransferase 1
MTDAPFAHVELFAGIGGFAQGLGADYQTVLANDNDLDKISIYRDNHGRGALKPGDIIGITAAHISGRPDVLTAGFPCVDISEAGRGDGIHGARSGVFWEAVRILQELNAEGRAPRVAVVENVKALYTARNGQDFAAVVGALCDCGYAKVGAVRVDAIDFTAQSRERCFIIAADDVPAELMSAAPIERFTPESLRKAVAALPAQTAACWFWPKLPVPPPCDVKLVDILMDNVVWHDRRQTEALLEKLSAISRAKIDKAATGERAVFAAFMRTKEARRPAARNQDRRPRRVSAHCCGRKQPSIDCRSRRRPSPDALPGPAGMRPADGDSGLFPLALGLRRIERGRRQRLRRRRRLSRAPRHHAHFEFAPGACRSR